MSNHSKSLNGRVVAITGGARGIGRATAQALVDHGARVAIGDIDAELALRTAAELGDTVIAFELDVTDRESFAAFLNAATQQLGPLDVLVNNAGIMPIGPFTAESDATADRMIDINVRGVILGSKLALDRMQPRGRGHIINVASQAGKAGFAGGASYCASKHAVVGLTASLADELAGTGIKVSCVMPAIVNTDLSAGMKPTRFIKPVEATDVADAIVSAIKRPRLNVHVPKAAAVTAYAAMLPIPIRRRIERLAGAEHPLVNADPTARAAYEARAARTSG